MATIAVLGTMDTKGEEHAFVAQLIQKHMCAFKKLIALSGW